MLNVIIFLEKVGVIQSSTAVSNRGKEFFNMNHSKKQSLKNPGIFQWFLLIFTSISIIFCLILIPLFYHLRSTFSNLEMEKSRQQLDTGAMKLENTVTSILYSSSVLSDDTRFIPFHYIKEDYASIPVNICIQLRNSFNGLFFPLDLVSDAAIQFDENAVVTLGTVFFEGSTQYYPDFFSVKGLSFEEWEALLSEEGSGFLPVQHVKTHNREYDALIYASKWENSSHIYACMDMSDVKRLFISDSDLTGYYIVLRSTDGTLLYTDLPEQEKDFVMLTRQLSNGNLNITVYIADQIFYQKIQPMLHFLFIYGIVCAIVLILVIATGTHISVRPIRNITRALERSKNIPELSQMQNDDRHSHSISKLYSGFTYISERILSADYALEQYLDTLNTQQKILQARFLEKAINGYLLSDKEISLFHSYFPDFPDRYHLLLLRLQSKEDNSSIYPAPLFLLQSFLTSELPQVYQQQFSDSDLLLLISEEDFDHSRQILDFMIKNINEEEPSYSLRGVISGVFQRMEELSGAYDQIKVMIELHFPCDSQKICTMLDYQNMHGKAQEHSSFTMTDLITMYTAITHGNYEFAMEKLQPYAAELGSTEYTLQNHYIYEMVCSILTCIKLEHPLQLMDVRVPAYNSANDTLAETDLYSQLSRLIQSFCDLLQENDQADRDPFVDKLLSYIDSHYTDCELCLTTLETHFNCSASTIRKAFKSGTNTTVSHYIEQKRMKLACELLSGTDKAITDIALECGYTTANSFYKAYKRCFGYAPTQMARH